MKFSHRRIDTAPTLDMTADGRFREPPKAPVATSILRYAVIAAVVAGSLSVAALVLWFALILIPVAIGAAFIAYGAFRWSVWRRRASFGRANDISRR